MTHGCDASVKDFAAFVRSQDEGEIEDNDLWGLLLMGLSLIFIF